MIAVSNTSPIIFLRKLNRLSLLNDLYKEIWIPEHVILELGGGTLPDFIKVRPLNERGNDYLETKMGRLHAGELAAIALALELDSKRILLDDKLARKEAAALGLSPLGTLGI